MRIISIISILGLALLNGYAQRSCGQPRHDSARSEGKWVVTPQGGEPLPRAESTQVAITPPRNVNMIGKSDLVGQATYNGQTIQFCTPGKQVPQNEVAGAVNPTNPLNLVAGSNDYRALSLDNMHYVGGGGVYRSTDGGRTWQVSFLPKVVKWNPSKPGKYNENSDPTISASVQNTFWFANLVFNRETLETAIAISRSTDGGKKWRTTLYNELSGEDDVYLINDKPWIGADPKNPKIAHVVWALYRRIEPERTIGYTRTTDGGKTWEPFRMLIQVNNNHGPQVAVDDQGVAHVVWLSRKNAGDFVGYRSIHPDGSMSKARLISKVRHVMSPVPWGQFFTNSFPRIAVEGQTIHLVWANWNGKNGDIAYIRSTDGGRRWSNPKTIAGGSSDQLLPAVAARNGVVGVGFLDHKGETGSSFHTSAVVSSNSGTVWSQVLPVSSASSTIESGNQFGYPQCDGRFIGDYNDVAVDSKGNVHVFWTDVRTGNSPGDPGSTADQDPYVGTFSVSK
jgi:hypothetical protein